DPAADLWTVAPVRYVAWIVTSSLLLSVGCATVGAPPGRGPVAPALDRATGRASYYHSRFQGSRTASGERYDETKLTAAHRTLPPIGAVRGGDRQAQLLGIRPNRDPLVDAPRLCPGIVEEPVFLPQAIRERHCGDVGGCLCRDLDHASWDDQRVRSEHADVGRKRVGQSGRVPLRQ